MESSKRWNEDIAFAMTPLKLLMWPLGGWPLQDYDVFSLIRCIVATFCMSIVVVLPCIEIYLGCTDADSTVDASLMIFSGAIAVSKTIWFRIYASNLTKTYRFAVNDYWTIENAEQRAIMLRQAFIAKTLMYVTVSSSYINALIHTVSPFIGYIIKHQINVTLKDAELDYALPSRCTLKYLNAPQNMYATFCIIELILMTFVCTSYYGNDALFIYIILHICGQVKILKSKFTELDATESQVYSRFNALIQRHSNLIAIMKILANTSSFVIFLQLFLGTLLLVTLGFQLILALQIKDFNMMFKSFTVLSSLLAQITMYCVIGDYLKSEMEEVGAVIYQSDWYDFPPKMMRNLIFIFMRLQSPVQLHAARFIVINLATYMSILKTSMSYLSVLRVMVEP